MIDLLTSTGFGSCLMLALGFIGIPLAAIYDKRRRRP